jgi:hypothetical protein
MTKAGDRVTITTRSRKKYNGIIKMINASSVRLIDENGIVRQLHMARILSIKETLIAD